METDLERLVVNAVACVKSLTLATNAFVEAIEGMKAASLKCDRDLAQKQAMADAEINRRRSEIEELKDQRHQLELEIKQVRKKLEAEKREVGRELENLRSLLSAA
jgi:hypothetical protein